MFARISEQLVHELQKLLRVVAVDYVVCPGELAFRGGERDDRQLRRRRLHRSNDVLGVEVFNPTVKDQGIDLRKHV